MSHKKLKINEAKTELNLFGRNEIRRMIRDYNIHTRISKYAQMTKDELIKALLLHTDIFKSSKGTLKLVLKSLDVERRLFPLKEGKKKVTFLGATKRDILIKEFNEKRREYNRKIKKTKKKKCVFDKKLFNRLIAINKALNNKFRISIKGLERKRDICLGKIVAPLVSKIKELPKKMKKDELTKEMKNIIEKKKKNLTEEEWEKEWYKELNKLKKEKSERKNAKKLENKLMQSLLEMPKKPKNKTIDNWTKKALKDLEDMEKDIKHADIIYELQKGIEEMEEEFGTVGSQKWRDDAVKEMEELIKIGEESDKYNLVMEELLKKEKPKVAVKEAEKPKVKEEPSLKMEITEKIEKPKVAVKEAENLKDYEKGIWKSSVNFNDLTDKEKKYSVNYGKRYSTFKQHFEDIKDFMDYEREQIEKKGRGSMIRTDLLNEFGTLEASLEHYILNMERTEPYWAKGKFTTYTNDLLEKMNKLNNNIKNIIKKITEKKIEKQYEFSEDKQLKFLVEFDKKLEKDEFEPLKDLPKQRNVWGKKLIQYGRGNDKKIFNLNKWLGAEKDKEGNEIWYSKKYVQNILKNASYLPNGMSEKDNEGRNDRDILDGMEAYIKVMENEKKHLNRVVKSKDLLNQKTQTEEEIDEKINKMKKEIKWVKGEQRKFQKRKDAEVKAVNEWGRKQKFPRHWIEHNRRFMSKKEFNSYAKDKDVGYGKFKDITYEDYDLDMRDSEEWERKEDEEMKELENWKKTFDTRFNTTKNYFKNYKKGKGKIYVLQTNYENLLRKMKFNEEDKVNYLDILKGDKNYRYAMSNKKKLNKIKKSVENRIEKMEELKKEIENNKRFSEYLKKDEQQREERKEYDINRYKESIKEYEKDLDKAKSNMEKYEREKNLNLSLLKDIEKNKKNQYKIAKLNSAIQENKDEFKSWSNVFDDKKKRIDNLKDRIKETNINQY